MTDNRRIATTIIEQLGPNLPRMTGARDFVAIENGVQFKLPRNKTGANTVRITLNSLDLYDVEFWSVTAKKSKLKCESGFPVDTEQLRRFFENRTGFYLTL